MKIIETEEIPKFKPVTVVFESAEIDYIVTLLGASGQHVANHAGLELVTHDLFDKLCTVASKCAEFRSDKITIKTLTKGK